MEQYFEQLHQALDTIVEVGGESIRLTIQKDDDDLQALMTIMQEEEYEGRSERMEAMFADLAEWE